MPKPLSPEALKREQDAFIRAFLSNGRKSGKACKTAKISAQKLSRWRKDPLFSARLEETKAASAEAEISFLKRLNGLADKAIERALNSIVPTAETIRVALRVKEVAEPEIWDADYRKAHIGRADSAPLTMVFERGPDRPSAKKVEEDADSGKLAS